MTKTCRSLVFLVLVAGPDSAAPAAVIGRLDLVCPVDGHSFRGAGVARESSAAGVDRDLFGRSGTGVEGVFCLINTCPKCLYSGYIPDFNRSVKVPEQVKQRIMRGELRQLAAGHKVEPGVDQLDIPATLRYALATRVHEWLGHSDEALAWLHLRRAWTCREEGSILPKDDRITRLLPRLMSMLPSERSRQNQADRELEVATRIGDLLAWSRLAPEDRPIARLVRAFLLRRHGECLAAQELFKGLEHDDTLAEPLRRPIPTILATIDAELASLAMARRKMTQAMSGNQIDARNVPTAAYLLGEMNRRMGDCERAVEWYDRVIRAEGVADGLKDWAVEQRELAREAAKPVR